MPVGENARVPGAGAVWPRGRNRGGLPPRCPCRRPTYRGPAPHPSTGTTPPPPTPPVTPLAQEGPGQVPEEARWPAGGAEEEEGRGGGHELYGLHYYCLGLRPSCRLLSRHRWCLPPPGSPARVLLDAHAQSQRRAYDSNEEEKEQQEEPKHGTNGRRLRTNRECGMARWREGEGEAPTKKRKRTQHSSVMAVRSKVGSDGWSSRTRSVHEPSLMVPKETRMGHTVACRPIPFPTKETVLASSLDTAVTQRGEDAKETRGREAGEAYVTSKEGEAEGMEVEITTGRKKSHPVDERNSGWRYDSQKTSELFRLLGNVDFSEDPEALPMSSMRRLIRGGANPNCRNGNTPLHYGARTCAINFMRSLIKYGAGTVCIAF